MARTVLEFPGEDVGVFGGQFDVYGTTSGGEEITILTGTDVWLDPSFNTGGDTIRLPGEAEEYTARVEGSYVILESIINDVTVEIPVGPAGITIVFGGDDSRTLYYDTVDMRVEMDGEVIDGTADPLSPGADAPPAGQIYNLTQGSETIVGTEGDDRFRAGNNELGAGDLIMGEGGNDRLEVFVDDTAAGFGDINYSAFELQSVEQVLVTNDGGETVELDMSSSTGVEVVGTVNSGDDGNVVFNYLTSLADILIRDVTGDLEDVDLDVYYQTEVTAGADDAITLTIENSDIEEVSIGTIDNGGNVTLDGIETVNIVVDGDSSIEDLWTDLTNLNISGMGDFEIEFALHDTVRNIDATGLAGDVDIDFSNNTVGVTYDGSAQVDVVEGGAGNDTINGNAGNDDIDANDGNDTINGGDGDDILDAGAGNDITNGDAGNDDIYIGTGNDTANGGTGDDDIHAEGTLNSLDVLNGGDGNDNLYVNAGTVDADYTGVSNIENLRIMTSGTTVIGAEAQAGGIVNVYGTSGNDVIDASAYTVGLTIYPGMGTDTLLTGSGDDTFVFVGDGALNGVAFDATDNDTIDAGTGLDTLVVNGDSYDNAPELSGIDVITLMSGGVNGNQYGFGLFATGNADETGTMVINGGTLQAGESVEIGAFSADHAFDITTGGGDDIINTSTGDYDDQVRTGAGDDIVSTYDGDDDIHLGAGDDYADAGLGADRLYGDTGADVMDLGVDADVDTVLYANLSDSSFAGGDTRDTINEFVSGDDVIDISELLANNGIASSSTEFIHGQTLDQAEAQMVAGDGIYSIVFVEEVPGDITDIGLVNTTGYFFVDINDDGELGGEDLQLFVNGDDVVAGDVDTTLNISGESGYDIFLDDMGMGSMAMAMAMSPMKEMSADASFA